MAIITFLIYNHIANAERKKYIIMTIDPDLLKQMQVEGITDADYERVKQKIENTVQTAAFLCRGLFIVDMFKMTYYKIDPLSFSWDNMRKDEIMDVGIDFMSKHIRPEYMRTWQENVAYGQFFFKQLPPEHRHDYIIHNNFLAMCQSHKILMNTRAMPLEFAPDGSVWLILNIINFSPSNNREAFCIHNVKTNELQLYDIETGIWTRKVIPHLTTTEKSILTMMSIGKEVKDISILLSRSENTIRSHQKSIFNKYGVHNNIEAVEYAKKYYQLL